MRRAASHLLAGYVGAVVVTKELERRGALGCGCDPGCWCQKPGLSLVRWTIPIGHAAGSCQDG